MEVLIGADALSPHRVTSVVLVVALTFHGPIHSAFAHHEDQRIRLANLAVATLIHKTIASTTSRLIIKVSPMLGQVVLNAAKR